MCPITIPKHDLQNELLAKVEELLSGLISTAIDAKFLSVRRFQLCAPFVTRVF